MALLGAMALPTAQATGCTGADQCETVTAPGGVEVQGAAGAGVATCQDETADLPLFCEAAPGSIGGSGAGVASFDSATDGVGWSYGNRLVTINVEYNLEAPCLAATLACGFQITVCNNRDLDYDPVVCSDQGGEPDQLFTAYSNEPATDVDCGDGKNDDEKDCSDNDGTTVGITVCLRPSVYYGAGTLYDPTSPGKWNNADQIAVYIGAWVGKVTDDPSDANLGVGLSAGTYEVGLIDNGPGCTIASEDLPAAQPSSPLSLLPECFDLQNNDYDAGADWPFDTGCDSPLDSSEFGGNACDDGVDNDHDGNTDWPNDPGCTSSADTSERESGNVCDDGLDNDGDTFADFPSDPGCASNVDNDERGGTTCDNGVDDDGDGAFDYPADTGCSGPRDNTEGDPQARRVYGYA